MRALRTGNPSTTAFMELRAREAHAQGRAGHARLALGPVRAHLGQPEDARSSSTEDSAFWQHEGMDYEQLRESMETNWERGEFARGASTITQQLAKNLYLSPSKNPIRKLKELLITRRLEVELSKQRILEIYLNSIEWGDGVWGAEAAARRYFRKSAAELSAIGVGAAGRRDRQPAHHGSRASPSARLRRRQQMIMRRMGAVTPPPVVAEPAPRQPRCRDAGARSAARVRRLPGTPVAGTRPAADPRRRRTVDLGNKSLYLLTLTASGALSV